MTSIVLEATGKRYKITQQPFIGDLRLIKAEFGVNFRQVTAQVSQVNLDGSNYLELLDDEEFQSAFLAWIWLLRLRSGERDVTADDVRQMSVDEFWFERDRDDDQADAGDAGGGDDEVPTSAPTDGGRGDAADDESGAEPVKAAGGKRTPRSTKTSKPRS